MYNTFNITSSRIIKMMTVTNYPSPNGRKENNPGTCVWSVIYIYIYIYIQIYEYIELERMSINPFQPLQSSFHDNHHTVHMYVL